MINEYVNKTDALAFVKSEIKEISERWTQTMVSIKGMEKAIMKAAPVTEEMQKQFEEVETIVGSKQGKKLEYALNNVSDELQAGHKAVGELEKQKTALDNMNVQLKEMEEYLEVATAFKVEIAIAQDLDLKNKLYETKEDI